MSINPAAAAIKYVIEHPCDSPIEFLRCWYYGDFGSIRKEWEDVPDEVFIGADPTVTPNVEVGEHLQRMAKDAARYRWLRDHAEAADWEMFGYQDIDCTDAAIDAAMGQTPND